MLLRIGSRRGRDREHGAVSIRFMRRPCHRADSTSPGLGSPRRYSMSIGGTPLDLVDDGVLRRLNHMSTRVCPCRIVSLILVDS